MDDEQLRADLSRAPLLHVVSLAGLVTGRRWELFVSQQHGMTSAGVNALVMIALGTDRACGDCGTPGRANHAELARRLWIRPATLTGIVDTLVRAGYVRRERDSQDRRVVWLILTEAGADRVCQLADQIRSWFGSTLAVDDPDHEKIIREYLTDLVVAHHDKEHMSARRPRRRSTRLDPAVPET